MSNTFTIKTETEFQVEVVCTECGRSLENTIDQDADWRGDDRLYLTVAPCETCLDKARDEAAE